MAFLESSQSKAGFKHRLWMSALAPIVILIALSVLLSILVDRLLSSARSVDRTQAMIAQTHNCLRLAVDMETGLRGYQVTGETNFLAPYFAGRSQLTSEFLKLQALSADSTEANLSQQTFEAFENWQRFADDVLMLKASGASTSGLDLNIQGKLRFDQLRGRFEKLLANTEAARTQRAAALQSLDRRVKRFRFIVSAGIGVAIGGFLWHEIRKLASAYEQSLAETRELNRDLETRVQARTRELTQANERLKEVDRLKSEFLATMSHELRTPLNSIIGFTEIVLAQIPGPLNAEQKNQLRMALTSAKHLLHLINDLLDLARIESGRIEPVFERVNPREVADEALQTVEPLAQRKNLPLAAQFDLPEWVTIDRKMLFQILLNLLNNAVKFTHQGSVVLEGTQNSDEMTFAVRDTGIGIKPDQLPRLFEAFRQVEGSASRRYEGTGLGLYLCKRLAGLLGGRIWVQSEPGKGSSFYVALPLSSRSQSKTVAYDTDTAH